MADIREFPKAGVKLVTTTTDKPVHGGYPTVSVKVDVREALRQITASQQIVEALKFYASQGSDGGEMARRALFALQQAVDQAANQPNY